eukprot:1971547-Amphidinium_carterae.1
MSLKWHCMTVHVTSVIVVSATPACRCIALARTSIQACAGVRPRRGRIQEQYLLLCSRPVFETHTFAAGARVLQKFSFVCRIIC